MLWTAPGIGSGDQRLPMDPEWDDGGIRIELVR